MRDDALASPSVRSLIGVAVVVMIAALGLPASAQDIQTAREQVLEIQEQIEAGQARADEASQRYDDAQAELSVLELDIARLQSEVADAQAELDGLTDDLRAFAVERYTGETLAPDVVEQDDLNEYSVMSYLARDLQLDSVDVVDTYRFVKANLDAATEELDDRIGRQEQVIADLEEAREQLYAELDAMNEELERRQAILDQLEEEERRRIEAELAARRAEEARQRAAAEAAARAATTTSAASSAAADEQDDDAAEDATPATTAPPTPSGPIASGSWVCPVQGATSFSDTFGAPRSGGRRHQGVDMSAAHGTPVVAPVSGTVTLRDDSIGGLSFRLNGDDGNYYFGTHMSSYGNSGYVQAGTIVGYVGESGNASTPHLHFEIHQGGRGNVINPTATVSSYC